MKLAVIDLDMVVADNTARFAKAEEAKQAFLNDAQVRMGDTASAASVTKEATNIFWRTAFTPELVSLDTIMPGAKENLETLRYKQGYELLFLTSRPDTMYNATIRWLHKNNVLFLFNGRDMMLVMKAPAFQYVKTVTWKAGMVQTLAALYGADTVLFIDDELNNTEATIDAWNNDKISLRCCTSLEMAVKGFTEF